MEKKVYMSPFPSQNIPLNNDPNFTNAVANYSQSCNNLETVLYFHKKELMIKAILEKFSKFAFDLPNKKLYMPIGLNSTPPSMIMDQFYPFETEYIVGLLEKELNEINKKEISEDANT